MAQTARLDPDHDVARSSRPRLDRHPHLQLCAYYCGLEDEGRGSPAARRRMDGPAEFESLYPSKRLLAGRHCRLAEPGRPTGSSPRILCFEHLEGTCAPAGSRLYRSGCAMLTEPPRVCALAKQAYAEADETLIPAASPRPGRGAGCARTFSSPCRGCRRGRPRRRSSSIRAPRRTRGRG